MGKLTTYILVMSGIMLLMYYGGMITGEDTLLTLLLNPQNISFSSFFTDNIIAVIEGLAAAAVGLILIASGKPELAAMSVLAIYLGDLAFNFIKVFTKLASIGAAEGSTTGNYLPLAVLLFAPLILLFCVTLAEWWRGVTT